jgi:hypothetical protein
VSGRRIGDSGRLRPGADGDKNQDRQKSEWHASETNRN